MTIEIKAENIHDARQQLGLHGDGSSSLTIKFRKEPMDYGRHPAIGCIVENRAQGRIPLEFVSSLQAVAYIKKILLEYDKHVREENKRRKKEVKEMAKKVKAK